MQQYGKCVVSGLVGLEHCEAFLIGRAIKYDSFELFRREIDRICQSQLLDSVWGAYHHVDHWALRFNSKSILVLLEGHVPRKQLPDTHVYLWVFLILFGHLFREFVLVAKGLVKERHNKSVLGDHQYLWRVQFVHRLTLVFQFLYSLLDDLLKTMIGPEVA